MGDRSVTFTSQLSFTDAMKIIEDSLQETLKTGTVPFQQCENISKSIQVVYKITMSLDEDVKKLNESNQTKDKFIAEYKNLIVDKNKTIIESGEENKMLQNTLLDKSTQLDRSVDEVRRLEKEVEELKNDLRELCEEEEPPAPPVNVSEKKRGKQKAKK